MPNYVRFLEGNDYLTLTNYEDGEIYGFGLVMDVPPAFSTAIRTDWLEKLNLEMPKTWEGLGNGMESLCKRGIRKRQR